MKSSIAWIKKLEKEFELQIDGKTTGLWKWTNGRNGHDSEFTIENDPEHYYLKSEGFANQIIGLFTNAGKTVLQARTNTWYSSSLILEFECKEYVLKIRNNHLAEWVISQKGKDILAYGLHSNNGKIQTKITVGTEHVPLVFHFLLWHLFNPVATENTDDDLVFNLLFEGN